MQTGVSQKNAQERDAEAVPAVSIIMPAYNVSDYIAEAIHSVQAQTLTDWELLVIDDGSTDDLMDVLEEFADDPRIKVHRFRNGGLPVARNRGLNLARAPLASLLDADDMFMPDYLEKMVDAISAAPDIAFVTCDAVMFGIKEREGRRFSDFEPQTPPITLKRLLARDFNVFVMCTLRTEIAREVGGFTQGLTSAEDFDLWVRLLDAGYRAEYVPEALGHYRRRADSLSNSPKKFRLGVICAYRGFLRRNGPDHPLAGLCRRKIREQFALYDFWRGRAAMRDGDLHRGRVPAPPRQPRTAVLAVEIVPACDEGRSRSREKAVRI